jgi:hypothetical protein
VDAGAEHCGCGGRAAVRSPACPPVRKSRGSLPHSYDGMMEKAVIKDCRCHDNHKSGIPSVADGNAGTCDVVFYLTHSFCKSLDYAQNQLVG